MSQRASAPWIRLAMTLFVVFGLLLDSSAATVEETSGDDAGLEFVASSDGTDEDVFSVQGDSVRVVRPGRYLGRAVDPRALRLRARPGGEDPFRRFREASSDDPVSLRLFGGTVGVIELRV